MYMGRKSFFLAILILFIFFFSTAVSVYEESLESKWKIEISLSKKSYMLREPIWLDVTLTNTSLDTARTWGLSPPVQADLIIGVTDLTGNVIPYTGPVIDLVRGEGWVLNLNEQFYDAFNLLELFASDRSLIVFGLLPVGSYLVKANYGGVNSKELKFNVVQPSEQEKEVYEKLIETFKIAQREGFDKTEPNLTRIARTYQESVYAEVAFRDRLAWNEFLEKFPNSGYCKFALLDRTRVKDSTETQKYLKSVISKRPNSRAARFAEQMLNLEKK